MALTAALKAQIAAWYKALQDQIPDFIPRAPQRQMIADVARTLAGEEGRHLAIEAPTGVGKTLSYLHRKRVESGERSVLVGLQSFAEGLDLKGELLTQVHIHKIAFPPIDSPVVITEGEWLKSLNRYPFEVQSLPSASFNLIQQVGRLIRSHACRGEVVIYDKRLLTKNYGQRLLNALPVFPIEQPAVPDVIVKPKAKPARRRRR